MHSYDWYVRAPEQIPEMPWGYDIHDYYDADAIEASKGVKKGYISGTYDPVIAEAIHIASMMGVDLVVELNKSDFLSKIHKQRNEKQSRSSISGLEYMSDSKSQKISPNKRVGGANRHCDGSSSSYNGGSTVAGGFAYPHSQHTDGTNGRHARKSGSGPHDRLPWHHDLPSAKWFVVTKSPAELQAVRRAALHHTSILVLDAMRKYHQAFFADPAPPLERPKLKRAPHRAKRVFHPSDKNPPHERIKTLASGDPYSEKTLEFRPRQHTKEIPPGFDPQFLRKAYLRLREFEKIEQEMDKRMADARKQEVVNRMVALGELPLGP